MVKIKTIKNNDNENSFRGGELKFLSVNQYDIKVRLQMLNGLLNRNNWIYENLEQHLNEFKGIPLLISYKDGQLGAGHEMDYVRNKDGTISQSFMSAQAERVVGVIPETAEIRLENIDGIDWVVTDDAIIFGWYAPELAERLKGTGNLTESEKVERAMNVSIETLIDEKTDKANGVEVFTKWHVLGCTILSDNTNPAVEFANIRALSEVGVDKLREITKLKVAQELQKSNPQDKKEKGVTVKMKIQDIKSKFDGFTVLALKGKNVALLSENGSTYVSTAEKQGDEIVVGENKEVVVNAMFGDGDEAVSVPLDKIVEKVNAENARLTAELAKANEKNDTLTATLDNMQKAEKVRRQNAVKTAIQSRLEEIKVSCNGIALNDCSDLLKDEKVAEYAEMVDNNGEFCGDTVAKRDVDARCMSAILETNKKNNSAKQFAWEVGKEKSKTDNIHDQASMIERMTNR